MLMKPRAATHCKFFISSPLSHFRTDPQARCGRRHERHGRRSAGRAGAGGRVGLAGAARSAAAVRVAEIEAPSPQIADAPDMTPESGTPMPEPQALALQEAPPPTTPLPQPAGTGPPAGARAPEPQAATPVPAPAPAVVETSARLKKGGTVAGALHGLGTSPRRRQQRRRGPEVARAPQPIAGRPGNHREAGARGRRRRAASDGTRDPAQPRREITLERDDLGDFSVEEEIFETVPKLQRASGRSTAR